MVGFVRRLWPGWRVLVVSLNKAIFQRNSSSAKDSKPYKVDCMRIRGVSIARHQLLLRPGFWTYWRWRLPINFYKYQTQTWEWRTNICFRVKRNISHEFMANWPLACRMKITILQWTFSTCTIKPIIYISWKKLYFSLYFISLLNSL